jgi:hypothetical protein
MAVHKKPEVKTTEKPASSFAKVSECKETNTEEIETQPVIISDVITETIEVITAPVQQSPQSKSEGSAQSSVEDPLNDFKEKVEQEMNMPDRPQKNFMWPILFIFIVAIVLLAGVFAYKQGIFKDIKMPKVNVVSVSPTPTVIPEPTKTVDLTKFEIEVLNGSEVSGLASKQKAALEAAGFTVSSVGNADSSDHADTIIKAKTEVDSGFIAKLKSTLGETFTVGDTQSLPEDSSVPVIVILGTKK